MSLGGLLFSEGSWKGCGCGREGSLWGETEERGGRREQKGGGGVWGGSPAKLSVRKATGLEDGVGLGGQVTGYISLPYRIWGCPVLTSAPLSLYSTLRLTPPNRGFPSRGTWSEVA